MKLFKSPRCAIVVVALLVCASAGAAKAAAPAPSKEIIECHKAIGTVVTKFFAAKQKAVGKCTDALFACQTQQGKRRHRPGQVLRKGQEEVPEAPHQDSRSGEGPRSQGEKASL